MRFALRFDFRNPAFAGTTTADRYTAALDIAEWADRLGGSTITLSEHHGCDDGYLPSPIPMLAAMAARTSTIRFSIAAIVAPFHDPLRLAEDLIVLDNLSRGRVDVIIAGGYVREEFELFGVPMRERPSRVTEMVTTLKAAFTGLPFEYRGRLVHLTPGPHQPGGPWICLGGSSEPAARRAARIADGFLPTDPSVWEFYRDEVLRLGRPDPGPSPIGATRTVALAEDAEKGWQQMGPYFLYQTNAYGAWQARDGLANPYRTVPDIDALRETGQYRVLTPDQLVADLTASRTPFVNFHPLCGGMPIDLAWSSLRLFEHEVLPRIR
ncbi:LLM class flavin-dependent oxidoreductase [Parafrankia elaeagni]|uniref:LLM class flavin-dependent oxidoreductase n=1 Tax=Parafrankia elaeagni TaxID=222534 RepID=UPI00036F31BE|nr:LLM class flavin-dependent oxidoreductase [Parafrankia elaeagni]